MSKLQLDAIVKIHSGKLEEFKQVAAQCLSLVKEKDTETLQYDWFLNADQTECIVREVFQSSDALLTHIGNLGDVLGKLLQLGDASFVMYGNPSPKLMEAVAGLDVKVYSPLQGLE